LSVARGRCRERLTSHTVAPRASSQPHRPRSRAPRRTSRTPHRSTVMAPAAASDPHVRAGHRTLLGAPRSRARAAQNAHDHGHPIIVVSNATLPCPRSPGRRRLRTAGDGPTACCREPRSRPDSALCAQIRSTNRVPERAAFIMAALDAGVPLRDVRIAARHADPRSTTIYDRRRQHFDRHAAYVVVAFVAGG
jgi:hypothetical protein